MTKLAHAYWMLHVAERILFDSDMIDVWTERVLELESRAQRRKVVMEQSSGKVPGVKYRSP